ncbi:hypothetical protein BC827DRAFT_1238005 [Russula dissimulans]|nr:hypothetical protein BC827DRAFT_1238005 [Russula dissimulans]
MSNWVIGALLVRPRFASSTTTIPKGLLTTIKPDRVTQVHSSDGTRRCWRRRSARCGEELTMCYIPEPESRWRDCGTSNAFGFICMCELCARTVMEPTCAWSARFEGQAAHHDHDEVLDAHVWVGARQCSVWRVQGAG